MDPQPRWCRSSRKRRQTEPDRSPWQRGTNENANRLLRQYPSKAGDLNAYDQGALNAIADRLNNRPRSVLDWRTPAEVLAAYSPI